MKQKCIKPTDKIVANVDGEKLVARDQLLEHYTELPNKHKLSSKECFEFDLLDSINAYTKINNLL